MSLITKKQTVYALKCDVCGKLYRYHQDYIEWAADPEWFENIEDDGWAIDSADSEKDYCEKHWQWSEDGEKIIAKYRRKQ